MAKPTEPKSGDSSDLQKLVDPRRDNRHNPLETQWLESGDDVTEQRTPGNAMEDLGQRRSQALTVPRGQNDRGPLA